ncbi:MAG: hypothetical protein H6510_10485 [Acidobacteria bacterium]|nr:hypothetical protein [Acidobacteriota bacterium]
MLRQLVLLHLKTGEPIGSDLIHKTRAVPFSPATIRHVLADLEARGYLHQPHTSAGRLPTDLGYRAFVNGEMLKIDPLGSLEKRAFETAVQNQADQAGFLSGGAGLLSRKLGLPCFTWRIFQRASRIEHVYMQRLGLDRLRIHTITQAGEHINVDIKWEESDLGNAMFKNLQTALKLQLEGKFLHEANQHLAHPPNPHHFDLLFRRIQRMVGEIDRATRGPSAFDYYGLAHLSDISELQEPEPQSQMIRMFDKVSPLKSLLDRSERMEGPSRVWIGSEMEGLDLTHLSVILGYVGGNTPFGGIGVFGPRRMPYTLVLQWLEYARHLAKSFVEA